MAENLCINEMAIEARNLLANGVTIATVEYELNNRQIPPEELREFGASGNAGSLEQNSLSRYPTNKLYRILQEMRIHEEPESTRGTMNESVDEVER